jgi:two-component system, NarL family, response regulator EvgA
MAVKKWHVLIVDQQPIVRNGIARLLEKEKCDFDFAQNGEGCSAALQEKKYDLLIIDIYARDWGCFEILEAAIKEYPSLNVILFTTITQEALLRNLYSAGCSIILKSEDTKYLAEGIKAVLNGMRYVSHSLSYLKKPDLKISDLKPLHFTRQEERILALCSIGLSSKEIAYTFELSKYTVDTYKKRLIKKFKSTNMAELIEYARSINRL